MDKNFEVFYQEDPEDSPALTHRHLTTTQVSTSQEASNIPEEIVLEEKTSDLLALLTAHAGGDSPSVPIVPWPPTPAPTHAATADVTKKKRKRGKTAKGSEEGKIPHPTQQSPTKEAKITKAHQKKCATPRTDKGTEGEQRPKPTIWNPAFVLSSGDPVTSKASLKDPQKGRSGLVFECLEKTLLLSKDMQELQGLRKRELFLSLKRDLAKVKFHPLALPSFFVIYLINHWHYFFFFTSSARVFRC